MIEILKSLIEINTVKEGTMVLGGFRQKVSQKGSINVSFVVLIDASKMNFMFLEEFKVQILKEFVKGLVNEVFVFRNEFLEIVKDLSKRVLDDEEIFIVSIFPDQISILQKLSDIILKVAITLPQLVYCLQNLVNTRRFPDIIYQANHIL